LPRIRIAFAAAPPRAAVNVLHFLTANFTRGDDPDEQNGLLPLRSAGTVLTSIDAIP